MDKFLKEIDETAHIFALFFASIVIGYGYTWILHAFEVYRVLNLGATLWIIIGLCLGLMTVGGWKLYRFSMLVDSRTIIFRRQFDQNGSCPRD